MHFLFAFLLSGSILTGNEVFAMARNNIYLTLTGMLEKMLSTMKRGALLPPEQELAERFGVSKPTLRRALADLAERNLIEKRNGVGNVVGGSARVIQRELIFLCHDVVFFAESIKRFSAVAAESNYLCSIVPLCGDADTQTRILATALARNPAGLVIYADPGMRNPDAARLPADCTIPVLYLIRLPEELDGNLLTFENADGIIGIVQRFYTEGCRRFALYGGGPVNPLAAVEREQGFREGLRRCRLKVRRGLICGRESSLEERTRFLERFRDAETCPDAVCCLNDACAGEFLREMRKMGIDLSNIRISGFDHAPLTKFLPHELLTVEPPMAELGECAAAMLIRQIENPHFGFIRKKLASRLIVVTPE